MTEESDVDVDLEDGELVSSDDEEDAKESSDKTEGVVKSQVARDSSPTTTPGSTRATDSPSLNTQSSIEPVSDDGEIYSDNEESAYFPDQVKSRPPPKEQKPQKDPPLRKRVSRWSDSYPSPPRRPRENSSPVRRRKRNRSESSDRDDVKEGSDVDDTSSSRERRSSREKRYNSPARSSDRQTSPDSKSSHYCQDRGSYGGQKWSRRGGYGSSSPYQLQAQFRYGRNRGGSHGNKHFPSLSAKEQHILSLEVPKRLEEGLSLLPDPKCARHLRVDLSIYPPPPTWYLRELKAWDTLHKPKPKPVATSQFLPSVPPSDPSTQPAGTASTTAPAGDATLPPPVTSYPIPQPIIPTPIPLMGSLASADFTPLETSEPADHQPDLTPLDPSMPFAEPLPSSHVPFAQPLPSLLRPQVQPVTSTDTAATSPTQDNQSSTLPSDELNTVSRSSEVPPEAGVASVEDTGLMVRSVADSDGGLMVGRSFSVSSEVNMEIDLRSEQSSQTPDSSLPMPSSPIFNPPSQSHDQSHDNASLPSSPASPSVLVETLPPAPTTTPSLISTATPVSEMSPSSSTNTTLLVSTATPTAVSTTTPSVGSTVTPTEISTATPSLGSTATPTEISTVTPSVGSTATPTAVSTATPTAVSTATPTAVSTATPTAVSTATPTAVSTATPTAVSTATPTAVSTAGPTLSPPTPTGDGKLTVSTGLEQGPPLSSGSEHSNQNKQPAIIPQNPREAIHISSPEVPSWVSPCNSREDSEPIKYNLRPRADSRTSENLQETAGVMRVSEEEVDDYDTYLNQLDDEEIPAMPTLTSSITLTSLLQDGLPKISPKETDPFSEDFPVINKKSAPRVPSGRGESLMSLVGGEKEERGVERSSDTGSKSTKRREKELTWKAKQRQRRDASKESPVEREKHPRPLCKYFMNGNCKNGDKCSFSHEGPRAKKKEICKFYKHEGCNKGADCMYYHGEFPCKFFHVKQYCRNGDNCKFSHAPLTAETEALLATVADSVTPPSNTPVHMVPLSPQPQFRQSSIDERVQISEEGIQIKMFGSTEQSESSSGLVVSIPKNIPEEFVVSIPLTKITDKMKFGRIPKKKPQSTAPPTFQGSFTQAMPTPDASLGDQTKEQSQNPPRRVLLPTPPPHTKLTPEDFKRWENSPHEYWEAPELSEPHPPPSGPHWKPPHEQAYKPQPPYPPRPRQPFYHPRGPMPPRPPHPEQNWNQQSPPYQSQQDWNQQSPPSQSQQNWNQPQRPYTPEHQPPRTEHNRNQSSQAQQNWNQSSQAQQNWNQSSQAQQQWSRPPPNHPAGGMELGPGNKPNKPPGGWNQRPDSRPNPSGGYPPRPSEDQRPRGMDPRHAGNDPRHSINDPRFSNQSDPRGSQPQNPPHYESGMRWGQPGATESKYYQSSPPYSGPQGASPPPPRNSDKAQGWSDKMSPTWKSDSVSPHWGTSPDHHSSNKGAADAANKRVDPRKKYSHLKIKSKNAPSSPSQSTLKRDSTETLNPGYRIPKLLTDPASLDKPIDPKDLFGADGIESQPYGEITFGTYKSPFTSSTDSSKEKTSTHSETDDQGSDTPPLTEDSTDIADSTSHESVPSYFAHIGSELGGGGLEIESAFGSLSEKGKENSSESSRSKESQARKLPSVFGYGM